MSHFAKVLDGKVVQVIVAEQEFIDNFIDSSPGDWIETSYDTLSNQHLHGGTPLRGNFAGIGFTYDREHDVFIPPKHNNSWILNTETWTWQAPTPMPNDGKIYRWNESTTSWIELE